MGGAESSIQLELPGVAHVVAGADGARRGRWGNDNRARRGGIHLNQDGKRIMLFQKGPYLIFMSGPADATVDRFVALGNQIQV